MDMDTSATLHAAKTKKRKTRSIDDAKEVLKHAHDDSLANDAKKKKKKKSEKSRATEEPAPVGSTSTFAETFKPQKPSAVAKAGKGRTKTVSVAIPGSILLNAQSPELRTYLAGQIARTCAIFGVDEIVVFHEPDHVNQQDARSRNFHTRGKYRKPQSEVGSNDEDDMDALLCRVLEYLETPQYLRRALIPMHSSLRLAGLLPPLDMHHHFRKTDNAPFREGVVVERPHHFQPVFGQTSGSYVDVGLDEPIQALGTAPVGQRVTVRMSGQAYAIVPSQLPKAENGYAWGYTVRKASSISRVMLECPYEGGYDLTIGTSERGEDVVAATQDVTDFGHALIVFGGLAGLELTIEADKALGVKAEDAEAVFDHWVNVCPNQGSRTIRTEEAVMIALSRLRPVLA